MENLPFDIYMVAGLSLGLLLLLCVGVLFMMRDPNWAPPRVVSRSVWCEARQRRATVDFVERVQTGLTERSVRRCSLRGSNERCGEECALPPSVASERAAV